MFRDLAESGRLCGWRSILLSFGEEGVGTVRVNANVIAALLLMSVIATGCSGEGKEDVSAERLKQMSGGQLQPTVPVSGVVTVDGTPEQNVTVFLFSAGSSSPAANATTNDKGEYCFSTYLSCDGVPPGDYQFGFTFTPKQKKNDEGQDVFKGKYRSPKGDEFKLTVATGSPVKDKNFDLKSK